MNYERLWERLIAALDDWSSARLVAPGRIRVLLPTGGTDSRWVEIVMTPDEWDDMASVAFGGFDYALDHVKQVLSGLGPAESFAVYTAYDLEPSQTPVLPPDPDDERLRELAREHPDGFGRWVAHPPRTRGPRELDPGRE